MVGMPRVMPCCLLSTSLAYAERRVQSSRIYSSDHTRPCRLVGGAPGGAVGAGHKSAHSPPPDAAVVIGCVASMQTCVLPKVPSK